MSIILLKGPAESRGPRVVSLPGEPLIYQEVSLGPNNTALSLPPLPFRNETGPQLTGLFIDFALTARQLEDRFWEGLVPFFSYTAALSLLLLSLRFILDAGRWPLASFFVGALAFRGALALETFLNTGEAQDYLAVFTGDWAPRALISPLIFAALALVIFLFTGLVHLVKPGGAKNV
jgi:hypothetical protein